MNKEAIVANYFIAIGLSPDEDYMTNLRLNKLMYFAQACSLVTCGKPLFNERIEAWTHGPVVPSVYSTYKSRGKDQIRQTAPEFSIDMLTDEELRLLSAVMAKYGKYSTYGLVELTHTPGGAWDKAFRQRSGQPISNSDIIAEFSQQPMVKLGNPSAGDKRIGYHNDAGTFILPADWMDEDSIAND